MQRLLILTVVSEAGSKDGLEIGPVLIQLGVVHVNCKQLETYTNMNSQSDRATWTLSQDNR